MKIVRRIVPWSAFRWKGCMVYSIAELRPWADGGLPPPWRRGINALQYHREAMNRTRRCEELENRGESAILLMLVRDRACVLLA